jgi:hypothetical protein
VDNTTGQEERAHIIKTASLIAISGNFALAALGRSRRIRGALIGAFLPAFNLIRAIFTQGDFGRGRCDSLWRPPGVAGALKQFMV